MKSLLQVFENIPSARMLLSYTNMCSSLLCLASPRLVALFLLLLAHAAVPDTLLTEAHIPTCRLGLAEYEVRYRDCAPKTVMALACSGGCHSYSRPHPNDPTQLERSCQCCRELGRQRARVRLRCPSEENPRIREYIVVRVSLPRRCACRPCDV